MISGSGSFTAKCASPEQTLIYEKIVFWIHWAATLDLQLLISPVRITALNRYPYYASPAIDSARLVMTLDRREIGIYDKGCPQRTG